MGGRLPPQPQQRLRDRDIAPHFEVTGIGLEFLPQIDVAGLAEGDTGEKQAWLAGRPAFPRLHVRLERPFRFILQEGV